MKLDEFEKQMKNIICKAGKASGLTLDWRVVSCDPDCVADFGCDYEGNLSIEGESFQLKIEDMTGIRYRWTAVDDSACIYRFDFGENIHLDYCFIHGDMYDVKYYDTYKYGLNKEQAIELIKQLTSSEG